MNNLSMCIFGHSRNVLVQKHEEHIQAKLDFQYDLKLYWLIDEQLYNGVHTFITGLRDGVDTLLAAYVLDCRRAMPEKNIKLHVVLAYKRQYRNAIEKLLIIRKADSVEYVGDTKAKSSYAKQEQRMIDLSSRMLAVYLNPMQESAYAYAVNKGITVVLHNPQDLLVVKSFVEKSNPNP